MDHTCNTPGLSRMRRDASGKVFVEGTAGTWEFIEKNMVMNEQVTDEDGAAVILNVEVKTVRNNCASGKIGKECYTVGPSGKKFFNVKKLEGLK